MTSTDRLRSTQSYQQAQGVSKEIRRRARDLLEARSRIVHDGDDILAQTKGDLHLQACSKGNPRDAIVIRPSHDRYSTRLCSSATLFSPSRNLTSFQQQANMILYATYWHSYRKPVSTVTLKTSWTHQYKSLCSEAFWTYAQTDRTLLQIFFAYAAAKEAVVSGRQESRLYLVQKSNTLAMVMRDVHGKLYYELFMKSCEP